ncbi:hypothetical protein CRYUN_Cryun06bG0085700 [Craigia yunnanensis]
MFKILNLTPTRIKDLLLIFFLFVSIFLVFRHRQAPLPFDITSSSLPPRAAITSSLPLLPHQTLSPAEAPTFASAIRVARVVKEAVDRNETGIKWFVFGDDDTVFIVDNLVKVLSKYDDEMWYYVGSNSENYEQNLKYSFDMAFGGGGFAISYSLGKVLGRVLDSCLMRYAHLYGSDARIWSCLAELGVGLTHEPGFHQVDMWDNFFGMLTAHPLSPLVSLHHLDAMEPLFPNMNKTHALAHFFKAVNVDSSWILQQTVCYDRFNSLTVSVAWGYAIQVYEDNQLLPDLLSLQKTFSPWKRGANVEAYFVFNTRKFPRDSCKRPLVFFLESVVSEKNVVWSNYTRHSDENCLRTDSIKYLIEVRVVSQKLELGTERERKLMTKAGLGSLVLALSDHCVKYLTIGMTFDQMEIALTILPFKIWRYVKKYDNNKI